jgi:apolipoprotein N-acyltransferase
MRLWIRLLLCLVSAAACFVAFVGFDQWYLAFVSWVPLFIAVEGLSLRRTFLLTLLMGTVAHFGGYYWLPATMRTFGAFSWPLAYLFGIVLNVYQGLSFAIMVTLWAALKKRGHDSIILAAAAFAAVEQIYPNLFPIFWGNTLYKVPVAIQSVDLLGVAFITMLIILVNFSVANAIQALVLKTARLQTRVLAVAAALWAANLAYGGIRIWHIEGQMKHSEKIKVGVVQGNLGLMEKRQSPKESLRRHREMSIELEKRGARLLVWSESAVSYSIPTDMKNLRSSILGRVSTPTIFGAIRIEDGEGVRREYNTAFLLDGNGDVLGYYDKVYLLAFGEYIPFGDTFPKLYEWSPNTGSFTKGKSARPLTFGEHRIGVMICYEDIIPGFVRKLMAAPGAESDIFVNITNDGWFGDTNEPWIHLGLSAMRSVEQRRWLIRSTNSGVSAAIDPVGRIVKTTSVMKQESFIVEAGFMHLKTVYEAGGWLFGYLCVAITALFLVLRGRKQPPPEKQPSRKRKKKSGK